MAVNSPLPVEVNTFKFIQLRKLKVLQNNESLPANVVNLVATSSRHGLVFIGLQDGFKVLKVENILDLNEDTDRQNFKLPAEQYASQKISSPPPVLLSLSADDMTLAVCVIRDSRLVADMYDIRAFADPDENPAPFIKIQLSSQSTGLKDFMWNPVVSEMYAFCLDSGDVHVHELAETTLKIIAELPPTTGATAVCWSPKGKQLVIGKKDGTLSQYKPTLQEVKKIPPPILGENNLQVLNVCWLATTQFATVYVPATNDPDKVPSLVFVSTPKGAPVSYVDCGDVCMGGTAMQTLRYTMHHQSEWNMLVCISSLSLETAVAGCINSTAWEQWILEDSGRADLPLEYNKETYPMGMGIVYCAQRKIVISDTESYPPMPLLFLLSSSGLLCPFHMLNTKPDAANLVFPSEPLSRDGERKRQGSPVAAHPTSILLQSPPNSTSVPAVAPGQASFGMSRMENPANFNFQSTSAPNISQATGKFGTPPAVLFTQTFQHVSPYAMPTLSPVAPQGIPDLVPQFQGFSSTPKIVMPAEPVSSGVKSFITPPTSGPSLASSFMNRPTDASSQPPTTAFAPPLGVIKSPENAAVVPKPTPVTVQKQIVEEKKEVEVKPLETENYTAAIINEMHHFEKELQELKDSFTERPIGTNEEMAFLKKNLLMLTDLEKEMSRQMQSLNLDIHSLKTASLENFSMVGEAKTRQQRRNDSNYNMMLRDRGLDPISAKRMQKIQNLHQYLIHQLQATGELLDQDLLEFNQKRKTHEQNIKQVNSAEAIYQTVMNNQNIIHLLMMNFQTLTDLFRRQKKGPRLNYALNGNDSDVDLSRLAETLLQEKPASDTDASHVGFSQPARKKLPSNVQSVLRDALARRKITCIKPTVIDHPSQSRLLSSSLINMEKKMSKLNVNASTEITAEKDAGSITTVVGGHDAESENIAASTSMVSPKLDLSQTPRKGIFAPAIQSAASPHYEDVTPPSSPEKSSQDVTEESVSITDKPIGVTSAVNAFSFTPVSSGSKMTDGVKNAGKPLGGSLLASGSTKSPFSTTSNLFLQPFQPSTFSFGSSVTAQAPDGKEIVAAHNDMVIEDAVSSIANSAALFSFNQGRQVTPVTLSTLSLGQVLVVGDSVKTPSAQRLSNESFSAIGANENQNAALSSMTKVTTPTFGGSPAFSVASFISTSPLANVQVLKDKTSVSNTSPGQITATLSSGIAPGTVFRVPASVFSQQSENAPSFLNQTSSSVFGKTFQQAAGTTTKSSVQRPVISNTFGQAVNATLPSFGSQIATAAILPGTSTAVSAQKLQFSTPTLQQTSTPASINFGQTASPSSGTMFGQMKPTSTTAKSLFTLTQPSITSALPVFSQTPINSTASVKTPLGQSVAPSHSAGIQPAVADSITESLSPLNLVATTADNATKSSGSFFQAASGTSNRPFIQILTTSVSTSIPSVTTTTSVSLLNQTAVTSTSPTSSFNQTTVAAASLISPSGQATIATTSATSLFSQSVVTTASSFGQSADSITAPTSPLGQAKDSTTIPTSPFGQPAVSATSPTSPFGQPAVSTTSPTSPFGQPAVSTTCPTSPFGQPAVSATSPTSPFGQPAVSATSPTSPFSQPAVPATSPTSPFSQAAVSSTSPASPFNQAAVSSTSPASPFGQTVASATSPTSPFGQIPAATSAATSPFNQAATTTVTSPVLFGQTVTTSTAPTPLFGQTSLPVVTSQFDNRPSGIFGQTPSAASSFTQNVNSSFGQTTVSPNASPFGQPGFLGAATPGSLFGQKDQTNSSSIFGAQSAALGFSFGKASSFGQNPSPAGSFGLAKAVLGQTPNSPSSSFGQPADPTTFGQGSFMGGLGGKPSEQNASKNIFSSPIGNSPSGGNGLFGGQGASTFGSKPAGSFTGGSFSAGSGSVAQSGFGAFQQTQKPAGFGAPASFGGSPAFGGGSPPSFGATPTFGNAQPASPFGTAQSSFSAFANADAPTFGSLASQTGSFQNLPAQQPQGNLFGGGSVFGGAAAAPSFGSPTQQSGFGSPSGGGGSSAFNQWRS